MPPDFLDCRVATLLAMTILTVMIYGTIKIQVSRLAILKSLCATWSAEGESRRREPCCQLKHCLPVVTRRNKEQGKHAYRVKSRWVRESQRAAHSLQACLRLARPLPAWVARVERAAPLVLDLAALALLALALVVGRFPQRLLRVLVVVAVVTLFLARLILALALASPRPSTAAPDSATE